MKKQVVIIGAGPAGLTAAYELLQTPDQYHIMILEATSALGGISKTVNCDGNRMDMGGHRFFSKSERVNAWWGKLMPLQGAPSMDDATLGRKSTLIEGGPNPDEQDRVMLVRNRVSRIYYRGKFIDYPISLKMKTLKAIGLRDTVRGGLSYLHAAFKKRPERSLEDFYINRFGKVLYELFFKGYTSKIWGRSPSEISPDWGRQRVKGLSISAILWNIMTKVFYQKKHAQVETSLIEEFLYPKYGPGQLWEQVANEIVKVGGIIRMNTEITGVKVSNARAIAVTTAQGETLPCDILISSMPIRDLIAAIGDVPAQVRTTAEGLPYRDYVAVGLLVDRIAVKNETAMKTLGNIVPDCWIYIQDDAVQLGRIQVYNNWSPYMVANPLQTVWLGLEYFCNEEDAFWTMDEEKRIAFVLEELKRIGFVDSGCKVLQTHVEHVKKAYPAYFDAYSDFPTVRTYLSEIQNLYCIGRNGQHRYNNMDHSMETAFEAVNAIRNGKTDKRRIWNVNTEQSYNEER